MITPLQVMPEQLNKIFMESHRVAFYLDMLIGTEDPAKRDEILLAHLSSMRLGCRIIAQELCAICGVEGGAG